MADPNKKSGKGGKGNDGGKKYPPVHKPPLPGEGSTGRPKK